MSTVTSHRYPKKSLRFVQFLQRCHSEIIDVHSHASLGPYQAILNSDIQAYWSWGQVVCVTSLETEGTSLFLWFRFFVQGK